MNTTTMKTIDEVLSEEQGIIRRTIILREEGDLVVRQSIYVRGVRTSATISVYLTDVVLQELRK